MDGYNPYMKVLGDLKTMMKKKMLDDKLHKSQHESMDDMKEEKEEKESYDDEEKDYNVKDYMNGGERKEGKGSALMVAISSGAKGNSKGGASKKGKKGKGKKGKY
jgi:hypothetical protein